LTLIIWTEFPGKDQLITKHYPQEFRDDVVKVARLHQISRRQVALDFGISAATLYKWLQKDEIKQGLREVMPTPEQVAEDRELRRRNRVLEQEVEILQRATAYFAKDYSPK
jgi:transposase